MNGNRLGLGNTIGDAVSRLRFSPESNTLLVSSWDSYLRLYNVERSELISELPSEAALLDCCFENVSTSFSTGSDGCIRRYDLNVGTIETIGRHDDVATSIVYSGEKGEVVSAGLDEKIKVWDARQRKSLVYATSTCAAVGCMAISGFNLVVCIEAYMLIYDLRNLQQPFQSCPSQVDVPIRCVTSVPCSRGYAVGSVDGRVALDFADTASSSEIKYTFRCHPKSKNGKLYLASVNGIEFNPCGSGTFVTGDNEGYVIAWDAQSRRKLFEMPRYPNSIASLAFNHTGELVAIASSHTYQEAKEKEEPPQVFIHRWLDREGERPLSIFCSDTKKQ
ncbi:PREDICTED: mitotic checkpoint protein BUB3.3 [Tarenaya hassleriana]|uniref:mitotic checkpoint protein BUB3.3 n=1 Tax=Tarenaya hassleriana TaxID=28532 RepID=UPI00053C1A0E|nr:PREDICTED: mitotic checkpoint protein BUB3.3 [Tarenaya hassleriana]